MQRYEMIADFFRHTFEMNRDLQEGAVEEPEVTESGE